MIDNINHRLDWTVLAQWYRLRFVKTSVIFLFLVPIIIKIIHKLETSNRPEWLLDLTSDLELPFSWQLFYIGALLFSVGKFLIDVSIPLILKHNADFGEFNEKARGMQQLLIYANQLEDNFFAFDYFITNSLRKERLSDDERFDSFHLLESREYKELMKPLSFADSMASQMTGDPIPKKTDTILIMPNKAFYNYINDSFIENSYSNHWPLLTKPQYDLLRRRMTRQYKYSLESVFIEVPDHKEFFWSIWAKSKLTKKAIRFVIAILFLGGLIFYLLVTINTIYTTLSNFSIL